MIDPTSRPFAWRNHTARRLWLLLWALPVLLPLGSLRDLLTSQRVALRDYARAWRKFMRQGVLPVLRFAWRAPLRPSASL